MLDRIKGGIIGVAVGDALGVPFEFKDRAILELNPVNDMVGYGTHNQPLGTWSDDSSMTFCTIDSLCNGYDIVDISKKYSKWYNNNLWTPRGSVFDIGITTRKAINLIDQGVKPEITGGFDEYSNGNGSLMRILPLVYYLKNEPSIDKRYLKILEVSSITHAHFRAVFSCFIYVEYGILLLKGLDKKSAYDRLKKEINDFVSKERFDAKEIIMFDRLLRKDITKKERFNIKGTGYVLRSLEASLWCFLTSDNYEKAVLKAVNLGSDTDTTGAITGGLAGLYYGFGAIPETWKFQLARYEDIEELIERFKETIR